MTFVSKEAPASACQLTGGNAELAATENGKTPIRMLARSAQPIDHWFWGRVVHDMAGVTHKDKMPIDYMHLDGACNLPIGVLDKIDAGNDGLFVEGNLIETGRPDDQVPGLLALSRGGVPFESSINFAGDGISYEFIDEDQFTEVNGFKFEGPGIVIRTWPLRGVAVCPYGADGNTSAEFSRRAGGEQTFSLTPIEDPQMTKGTKLSSGAAVEEQKTEEKPAEQKAAAETKSEEKPAEKAAEEKPAESTATPEPQAAALAQVRAEAKRFRESFGDKGAVWFAEGLTYEEARAKQLSELTASVKTLTEENAKLKKNLNLAQGEQEPVSFDEADKKKRSGFVSKIRFPGQAPAAPK